MSRMAGVGGGEEELSQNPEALTWQGAANPVMSLRLASWIGISWATCVCVEPAGYHAGKNHFRIILQIILAVSGGVQSTVETAPNKAIHLWWKQNLINSTYLLF